MTEARTGREMIKERIDNIPEKRFAGNATPTADFSAFSVVIVAFFSELLLASASALVLFSSVTTVTIAASVGAGGLALLLLLLLAAAFSAMHASEDRGLGGEDIALEFDQTKSF